MRLLLIFVLLIITELSYSQRPDNKLPTTIGSNFTRIPGYLLHDSAALWTASDTANRLTRPGIIFSKKDSAFYKWDMKKYTLLGSGSEIQNSLPWPKEEQIGTIYNSNLFRNTFDFTTNGSAALSINSGTLSLTGGDGTFNNYITLNKPPHMLPNWKIKIRFKLSAWSSTAYGIGIGLKSVNTVGKYDILGFVSTTNAVPSTQYISSSTSVSPIISGTSPAININDIVEMTAIFNDSVFTIITKNISTGSAEFSNSYTFTNNYPVSNIIPNSSLFSIYEFGGTHQIQSIDISSITTKNPTLLILGDSKPHAYYAQNWNRRFGWQLKNDFTSSIIYSGGSAQSRDILRNIPDLLTIRPVQVILSFGSNDIRAGRSTNDLIGTYDTIVSILSSANIRVLHAVLPEDSLNGGVGLTEFKNHIHSRYPNDIINTWDSLSTNNILKSQYYISDGFHPNGLGNDKIYQTALASNQIFNYNVRNSQFSASDGFIRFSGDSIYSKYTVDIGPYYIPKISAGNDSIIRSSIIDNGFVGIKASPANNISLNVGGVIKTSGSEAGILIDNRRNSSALWAILSDPNFRISNQVSMSNRFVIDSATGNIGIGIDNPQFLLDLFGGNIRVERSDNNLAHIEVKNLNGGNISFAGAKFTSNSGSSQIYKYSSTASSFKTVGPGDLSMFNDDNSGNISLLNNNPTGNVNITAGGSSTSHLTLLPSGRFGIGISSPTSMLHLPSGTSTANTAPLKFTSGTNLTTPENGAVEYDGNNYFVTSGSTRYTLAKTLTNTATLDFPSTMPNGVQSLTITVTGAAVGDVVIIGAPSIPAEGSYFAYVSSTNTVTIRFVNNSDINSADPASGTFRVSVLKY